MIPLQELHSMIQDAQARNRPNLLTGTACLAVSLSACPNTSVRFKLRYGFNWNQGFSMNQHRMELQLLSR